MAKFIVDQDDDDDDETSFVGAIKKKFFTQSTAKMLANRQKVSVLRNTRKTNEFPEEICTCFKFK